MINHLPILWLLGASLAQATSTKYLLVTSYDGHLRTLAHKESCDRSLTRDNIEKLQIVHSSTDCGSSPSWGTLVHTAGGETVLYCIDEGLETVNGTLTTYSVSPKGELKATAQISTPGGPVHAVPYGKGGLALPHYSTSTFTTWDVSSTTGILGPIKDEVFPLDQHGPDEDAPHPHETVLDPTGKFILVPDLGADLVRIFEVIDNRRVKELDPLHVKPGSGPRHLAFAVQGAKIFMYLVTELSNHIFGYQVTYPYGKIHLKRFWSSGTHGKDKPVPADAAAAEVRVSPDARFLVLSSRYEQAFSIPGFGNSSSETIKSDTLVTLSIDKKSGHLTLVQEAPAGGDTPRQFTINKAGNEVACGLQDSGRVVIIERDVQTGKLGDFIAYKNFQMAGVTSINYLE